MKSILEEGLNFPIEKITTSLTRNDLIVKDKTSFAIQKMETFLKIRNSSSRSVIKTTDTFSGFHAIFTGPSGTGKTLAASLLGKETGNDVYRIDLSNVVSKYIGETEKNLDKLFSRAQTSDVILFFDEADALFGKRTEVRDSHDRFANQEVSWLLQRIDTFDGILILAFNKKVNLDSPFFRRFNVIVEFEIPDSGQRLKLWRKYLPLQVQQELAFDVDEIARKYKLTGGEIVHAIQAVGENSPIRFTKDYLLKRIQVREK